MDCAFCNIAAKKIPAEVLFENTQVLVFKDRNPVPPIHLLVIPKRHINSVIDLTPDQRDITTELIYAAKQIAAEMQIAGYQLLFNVGQEGGQVVNHLHLHLMAGWKNAEERKGLWSKTAPSSLDI